MGGPLPDVPWAPTGRSVNPAVVETLADVGIDVTREFPKPLTHEVVRAAAERFLDASCLGSSRTSADTDSLHQGTMG